jgi:hypothetical protein
LGRRIFACAAGAALLPAAPGLASTTISTVAGGGTRTDDGADATLSSLKTPAGVRPVANGFLLAEQGRYRVRRVSIPDISTADTGTIATIAGSGNPGNGQAVLDGAATAVSMNLPCCLSTAASGDLLVADTLGGMVWRVAGSRIRTVAGNGAPTSCPPAPPAEIAAQSAALCFVVGVGAAPGEDRFLVAEDGLPDQSRSGGARVYEVDPTGVLHVVAGGGCPNPSPGAGPLGICLANPRGPLYTGNPAAPTEFVLADRGRNVIWKISSTNAATATASLIAGTAKATAPDLSDLGDGAPAGQATLSGPSDLAMTPNGNLLVADRDNCRVRRLAALSAASTITTVAGTSCGAAARAGDDGPATLASLSYPQGVSFSPAGILISESIGGRVRLVQRTSITAAPTGDVTSAAATFSFESAQPAPQFRCAIDSDTSPAPCTSPLTYAQLPDGAHTFTVLDAAPPADPSPARRSWVIDTTPPEPPGLGAPEAGAVELDPRPVFDWSAAPDATTGIDHYELVVDRASYATVQPGDCAGGVCSAQPSAELGEGPHTWSVRAFDRVGLVRESASRTIAVGSDPVAELSVAPDPVLVGNPVGIDASSSHDAGGPIARYEWDLDGDAVFETDTGNRPFVSRSFPLAGRVRLSVRITDGVGRPAVASRTLRVNNPPGAPRLHGVSVNGGADFTSSPDVTLNLVYPESATGVVMSNDGGFLTAMALDPSPKMRWRLASSGSERLPKTVYVRFLSGPFVTDAYSDDIILDETRPLVLAASARAVSASSIRGVQARSQLRRLVQVSARDNASGVAGMQISVGRRDNGLRFRGYSRDTVVVRGAGQIWVRVRDGAGNVSPWREVSFAPARRARESFR